MSTTSPDPTHDPSHRGTADVGSGAPPVEDSREGRLSIVAAILLGIAATFTAFSSYQAALTDGDALSGYAEATAGTTAATFLYQFQTSTQANDNALFAQWAAANERGETDVRDTMYNLMRPQMQAAVDWWNQTEAAVSPFEVNADNPYDLQDTSAEGDELIDESTKRGEAAEAADEKGDEFELAAVLLALTLFFAGIATLFRRRSVAISLLGVGALTLAAGTAQMFVGIAA